MNQKVNNFKQTIWNTFKILLTVFAMIVGINNVAFAGKVHWNVSAGTSGFPDTTDLDSKCLGYIDTQCSHSAPYNGAKNGRATKKYITGESCKEVPKGEYCTVQCEGSCVGDSNKGSD